MIEKIRNMMLAYRKFKFREILEALGTLYGTMVSIFFDHLHMRKLSARWGVLRLLTVKTIKAIS